MTEQGRVVSLIRHWPIDKPPPPEWERLWKDDELPQIQRLTSVSRYGMIGKDVESVD